MRLSTSSTWCRHTKVRLTIDWDWDSRMKYILTCIFHQKSLVIGKRLQSNTFYEGKVYIRRNNS